MFRFILLSALVAMAAAQGYNRDPKHAAIISEQRYLSGNGQFGAAYTQEDGTDFKEETDEQGNRRGSYSYVDPDGTVRKVSYVAGKNGFQATGDHLPVAPPAPPQPIPQPVQPQYQPTQAQRDYVDPYDKSGQFDNGAYDERWNDPSFQGDGRSAPINYNRPAAPQQNYNYQQQAAPAPAPAVRQQNYNVPQHNYNPAPQQYQQYDTTPSPHRFLPPGKLSLNRTPDGFSYTFNKA
jgi:hypothetical protein